MGYHSKHVYRLQREPDFREAVQERMRAYLGINLPRVYATLFTLATDRNDIKAAELLLKAAGELGASGVNVTTTVTQANATDADTAEAGILRMWADRLVNAPDEPEKDAEQPHRRTGRGRAFRIGADED